MNTTCQMLLLVVAMLAWFTPTAHARWYDPSTGRWTTRDPAGYVDGMNRYQYVVSNPLRFSDAYGLQAEQPSTGGGTVGNSGLPACKDKCGNDIEMTFDGQILSGGGFKEVAVSGRVSSCRANRTVIRTEGVYLETIMTFDYTKQRQKKRSEGPLPEGDFYFCSNHEDSADGTNNPSGQGSSRHKWWHPAKGGWGDYSWPLTPMPGTDTSDEDGNPRGGFFVHGGREPGSAGCIDLMDNDKALHDFMNEIRNRTGSDCCIKISVRFGAASKSIIQKRYTPWMGPGSISPWMPN